MSGRHINDHASWMGGKPKGSVLPHGAKMKEVSDTSGAGSLMSYEDTTEKIMSQQEMGVKKIHGHARKEMHRN